MSRHRSADMVDRYASRGFRVLIYGHSAKLESQDNLRLVLDSLRGNMRVDLLIITSLVGRADGSSAAGPVPPHRPLRA